MNTKTLNEAIEEAKRFIEAARCYIAVDNERNKERYHYGCPRESGAVRRASMDLTRKLADLRQGR